MELRESAKCLIFLKLKTVFSEITSTYNYFLPRGRKLEGLLGLLEILAIGIDDRDGREASKDLPDNWTKYLLQSSTAI